MSYDMKTIKKDLYDAALITAGATAVGFAFKKASGDPLNTPGTLKGVLKLGVAVGLGTAAVKFLQAKKYIPTEPKF